jgi:hypothetical protein
MQRTIFAVLAFFLALPVRALAPAPAPASAPARPQIQTTKVDGTDGVYIFRNGNPQSIFIVTNDGVIATDPVAYGRPTGGADYVAEIRKVTSQPIKYLIYSHHHFDHIAGGKAFKDAGATILAHQQAKVRLEAVKDPFTPLPDEIRGDSKVLRLGTKKDVRDQLTLQQDASEAVKVAAREGKCWQPVEREMKLPKYENMPGYANGLPFVLRRYCGLWGRGT